MSQARAYRLIWETKERRYKSRARADANVALAREAAADAFGYEPPSGKIWRSQHSKDISREARCFLWMTTQDAYMVGEKWLRPTISVEKQDRAMCALCGCLETMAHILCECESPGQGEVWALVKELWRKRNDSWTQPSLGLVLASGAAAFRSANSCLKVGDARLYRILIIESAHLIWKLQCERVIKNEGAQHDPRSIRNRWLALINRRLNLDCLMMDRQKFGGRATPAGCVTATWVGVLRDEENLPPCWVRTGGVLVGMERDRVAQGVG
ncbi:hypothetical protein NEOLEDRAFT_1184773 [Neolentinus lepideus HHB14362 ss-1]|uniref:Reverse transcriptase zinc-binding domain-containing protein n=1 Tax=Neolentinus lepideus HHB14362 ss-1 TaxID=1314782 RepID=A0A165M6B3_9AGAM|nr:hypothetical protein NEOLEDRAFT_1184773 [Neolentinus lepideus HHB14362 ss-1]